MSKTGATFTNNGIADTGCDPYGVVRGCVVDATRGLRPRAMGLVCAAYLRFAAPQRGAEGSLLLLQIIRDRTGIWNNE